MRGMGENLSSRLKFNAHSVMFLKCLLLFEILLDCNENFAKTTAFIQNTTKVIVFTSTIFI